MTDWRPPSSITERSIRASRSMTNGTMDGKIISAFPVKTSSEAYFDYDESDETVEEEETSPRLLPWTDYFDLTPQTNSFFLSKKPWANPEMKDTLESRATIHIYWNGVFQRDLSYSLDGTLLRIDDINKAIRTGDTLTVKYFYEEGGAGGDGGDTSQTYRLEAWLESARLYESGFGYRVRAAGPMYQVTTGVNGGSLTMLSHRYATTQFLSGWTMNFRIPKDQTIPTDNVENMQWFLYTEDGSYTINRTDFTDYTRTGTPGGQVVGIKRYCGIGPDCLPDDQCPPPGLVLEAGRVFAPSVGPIGGTLIADGQKAIDMAKVMNTKYTTGIYAGEHRIAAMVAAVPAYVGGVPGLAGCRGPGGVNFDNTIWGREQYDIKAYSVKIGVTCVVTLKS